MNILIVHSDVKKANQLIDLIHELDRQIHILGKTSSHEEMMLFCTKNAEEIDLVFCDVHLNGMSTIEIANQPTLSNKIVFTSATKDDAYAAIKAGALDFLLEPFKLQDLSILISKAYKAKKALKTHEPSFKKRFMIKFGDKIQYRTVDEIAYIFAEGKMAYIITRQPSRKYIIEYTLDELEKNLLDPSDFFRINRKFIINIDVIEEARQYVNSRLKLILNPSTDFDMVVSREKVQAFKHWLNL